MQATTDAAARLRAAETNAAECLEVAQLVESLTSEPALLPFGPAAFFAGSFVQPELLAADTGTGVLASRSSPDVAASLRREAATHHAAAAEAAALLTELQQRETALQEAGGFFEIREERTAAEAAAALAAEAAEAERRRASAEVQGTRKAVSPAVGADDTAVMARLEQLELEEAAAEARNAVPLRPALKRGFLDTKPKAPKQPPMPPLPPAVSPAASPAFKECVVECEPVVPTAPTGDVPRRPGAGGSSRFRAARAERSG